MTVKGLPEYRLAPLPAKSNPCICCPRTGSHLHTEDIVAVGFGAAYLERDGVCIEDGEHRMQHDNPLTVAECERVAAADPDHDWRIVFYGPLHGETYQRHEASAWLLVETNPGFA